MVMTVFPKLDTVLCWWKSGYSHNTALLSSSLADVMGTNDNQNNDIQDTETVGAASGGRRFSQQKPSFRTQRSRLERLDSHPKSL